MSHSRRRNKHSRFRAIIKSLLVIVFVLVLFLSVNPTALVTSGEMSRQTNLNLAQDINGPVSLDKQSTVKAKGGYRELLTITNNFGQTITVTVSLQDPSEGTLSAGGQQGNEVIFDLTSGDSETVDIDVNDNIADGEKIYYNVRATSSGIDARMNGRSATANNPSNGNNNGNGNGNGPGNGNN